ncbi:unnamed protein product, partial [Sphacelaria rigidula]
FKYNSNKSLPVSPYEANDSSDDVLLPHSHSSSELVSASSPLSPPGFTSLPITNCNPSPTGTLCAWIAGLHPPMHPHNIGWQSFPSLAHLQLRSHLCISAADGLHPHRRRLILPVGSMRACSDKLTTTLAFVMGVCGLSDVVLQPRLLNSASAMDSSISPIQYSNTAPARCAWKRSASAGGTMSVGLLPPTFHLKNLTQFTKTVTFP